MNQADIGSNASPNAPRPNLDEPGQHAASSGTSTFAVLVGIAFMLMTTFFVLSFVAVWKRSEGTTTVQSSAVTSLPETTPVVAPRARTASEDWRKGTVNIVRPDLKTGVMRAAPDSNAPRAAFVPKGTVIDVGKSATKDGQMWYHVRAVINGGTYEGWMHSDIVLVEQQP
jgi:hypothetical protein